MRLFLVAALLCGFLGSHSVARADRFSVGGGRERGEQVRQNDGWLRQVAEEPQNLGGTAFRNVPSSQRVVSSRPTRLLPTHGGKPTNHGGRGSRGESLNPLAFPYLLAACGQSPRRTAAASPRLYYVIALRRLLC